MNNRHLSRGKRLDNGEWIIGSLLQGTNPCIYAVPDELTKVIVSAFARIDPATIAQCTGLKDKNGRLIFEGDIVVQNGYIWFDGEEPNYRGTVEWIYSQWQVVAHCVNPKKRGISDGANEGLNDEGFADDENSEWEIIGNIHDNPELLGEDAP